MTVNPTRFFQNTISLLTNTPEDQIKNLDRLLSAGQASDEIIAGEFSTYLDLRSRMLEFSVQEIRSFCQLLIRWQNKEVVIKICTQALDLFRGKNHLTDILMFVLRGESFSKCGKNKEAFDDFQAAWQVWKLSSDVNFSSKDEQVMLAETIITHLARHRLAVYDRYGALTLCYEAVKLEKMPELIPSMVALQAELFYNSNTRQQADEALKTILFITPPYLKHIQDRGEYSLFLLRYAYICLLKGNFKDCELCLTFLEKNSMLKEHTMHLHVIYLLALFVENNNGEIFEKIEVLLKTGPSHEDPNFFHLIAAIFALFKGKKQMVLDHLGLFKKTPLTTCMDYIKTGLELELLKGDLKNACEIYSKAKVLFAPIHYTLLAELLLKNLERQHKI